jgi:hypothetical protein
MLCLSFGKILNIKSNYNYLKSRYRNLSLDFRKLKQSSNFAKQKNIDL